MDGSLIATLAATYGAGVIPAAIVAWLLRSHIAECSDRRRHIHESIDTLRHQLTEKIDELSPDVHWIRGRLEGMRHE